MDEGVWLDAGDTHPVNVTLTPGATDVFEHYVVFRSLIASDNANWVQITCDLVGCLDRAPTRFSQNEIDFGDVAPGGKGIRYLEVTGPVVEGQEHHIADVLVTPSWIKFKRGPASISLGSHRETLQFICKPSSSMSPGGFKGEIKIVTTYVPTEKLAIPLKGTVTASVDVEPRSISFGTVQSGTTVQRKIRLVGPDAKNSTLYIRSLSSGLKHEAPGEENSAAILFEERKVGPFAGYVDVTIESSSMRRDLRIDCVGLITDTNP